MATVAGIGIGLFILCFLWVTAFLLCVTLSKAEGALGNLGTIAVIASIIITLILWFFPRDDGSGTDDNIIYDWNGFGRITMACFCGIMLLVGLIMMMLFHSFEPQRAEALKRLKT